ncbi:MAG: hypothetical protein KF883_05755 [Thermomicrobiales bacterium]|nr:hypothetical protein [Thermomicrobiales bacterium]
MSITSKNNARQDEMTLEELQDPDTWEDAFEIQPPVKSPRGIVSVGFSRDELSLVTDAADNQNMKLSAFIRAAALEKSRDVSENAECTTSLSATPGTVADLRLNRTRSSAAKTAVGQ